MFRRIYFFLISLLLVANQLNAQNQSYSSFQAGIKGGYGFIIPHSPTMEYIASQHVSKLELYVEKNTFGSRSWHQHYQFPRLGLSFNFFNLNNPKHLGNAYSVAPYMNFNLWGKKSVLLRLRTALGAGYLEKPFDPENNFKNESIGSYINLFFSVQLETEIAINDKIGLLLGADYAHFSNTSFKKPNKGINIPTIQGGLVYRFGEQQERITEKPPAFEQSKGFFSANLSFGLNEIYPPEGKKYLATYFSLGYEKRLSSKSSVGLNTDVFYNPAQRAALDRDSIYIDKGWENTQLGVSGSYTIHFGRFESYILAGYYLKKADEELSNIYTIFGSKIHLNERINAMIALKTHIASAEYLTAGLGYRLGKIE